MWRWIVFTMLVALTTGLRADENVPLLNPSFEETQIAEPAGRPDWAGGPPGWKVWFSQAAKAANASLEWERSSGRTGKRCVALKGCAGSVCVIQNAPVKPGQNYVCSAWAKRSNPKTRCELIVRWAKADKSWESTASVTEQLPEDVPAADWSRLDVYFTAPPNAAYAVIMLSAAEQGPNDVCLFDDVEMKSLDPDMLIVSSCRWMHPNLRPIGNPIVTDHISWGKPSVWGKIRALFLLKDGHNLREPFELAQRMDLDLDYLIPGNEGKGWFAFNNIEIMQRLREKYYDVAVVAGALAPQSAEYLAKQVKGLVFVHSPSKLPRSFQTAEVAKDHELREPLAALPDVLIKRKGQPDLLKRAVQALACGQVNGTRLVKIVYGADSLCLTPNMDLDYHLRTGACYWEAYLQLIARAILWAAGKEPTVRISVKPSKGGFTVWPESTAAFGGKVDVWVADQSDTTMEILSESIALDWDKMTFWEIEIPAPLLGSDVTCFAKATDTQGRVAGFACARGKIERQTVIKSIESKKPFFDEGETAQVTVRVDKPSAHLRLVGTLTDAFGRGHSRCETPVAGESTTLSFDLGSRLSAFNWVTVEIRDGAKVLDKSRWYLLAPQSRADWLKDYQVGTWAACSFMPAYLQPALHKMMREIEITEGLQSANGYLPMLSAGLWPISTEYGAIPGYVTLRDRQTSRPGCFSDPFVRQKMADMAREIAARDLPYRPLFGYLRDETSLVEYALDLDTCSCKFCQERYRVWLKGRYKSLDELNADWGTTYRSWDDIGFITYKEVRGKPTIAPWLMYRSFMDWAWAEGVQWVKKHMRQSDPTQMIALANTFGPNPFSGRDYYLLCKTNDYWMEYACETRSPLPSGALRYNFDAVRCFGPNLPNHPWVGYRFTDETIKYGVWWTALHGATGVSPYGALSLAPPAGSWALIFPTLQHTRRGQLYAEEVRPLKAGIGKLLMTARRAPALIAILWSQPSMYAAWALSGLEGHPEAIGKWNTYSHYFIGRQNLRQSIIASGRQFDYVCEEQIREGILKDYRCLALSGAFALSPEVAKQLEEFAKNGGTVIADAGCGLLNGVGRIGPLENSVEKIFGFRRKGSALSYDERKIQLPFGQSGQSVEVTCVGGEDLEPVSEVNCIKDSAGKVTCLIRKLGKGRTIFLNCVMPGRWQSTSTSKQFLTNPLLPGLWEEIPAIAEVASLDGTKHPADFELVLFENGPQHILGVLHNYMNEEENFPVRLKLPQRRHIFDVRAGKYLGQNDAIETDLAPGSCALYALLPYKVSRVRIQCSGTTAGRPCNVVCEIDDAQNTPILAQHVLHVDVFTPKGTPAPHYSRNVVAENGRASFAIPFALNDAPGDWKVQVRDVITGVSAEAAVPLR